MFIKDRIFRPTFSVYAERHFCKDFIKKYSVKNWLATRKTIIALLERAYKVQQKDCIDHIKYNSEADIGLFKLDFAVAGTKTSPKSSGNRCIFFMNNKTATINILLVYSKNHCPNNQQETQWVLSEVKNNFPEYKHLL